MYVLVATYLPSAALRGSGLVARALLRADLFEKRKKKQYKFHLKYADRHCVPMQGGVLIEKCLHYKHANPGNPPLYGTESALYTLHQHPSTPPCTSVAAPLAPHARPRASVTLR